MTAKLSAAMAKAFEQIEGATKSANNPHFKSKYADLGAVIDAVKPALITHDLFFTQHCQPHDKGVAVETVLHHASGESLSMGTLFVPANKQDAQGFGSALTYARRYALMTAFGVPAEDDDGNAAVRSAPATNGKSAPQPISDADRDLIQTLADGVGKSTKEICDAYKVQSLKELYAPEAAKIIARLKELKPETVQ